MCAWLDELDHWPFNPAEDGLPDPLLFPRSKCKSAWALLDFML
jgi:hypothetical protein